MTANRTLTDAGLDRKLEAWFSEGPESVADRIVETALHEIERNPERRTPGATPATERRGWMRFGFGLAAVGLLAGIGIAMTRLVDVSDSPSPSPSQRPTSTQSSAPTPGPTLEPMQTYSYPNAGYALTVGESVTIRREDSTTWLRRDAGPGLNMTITAGPAEGPMSACRYTGRPQSGACPKYRFEDASQMADAFLPVESCMLCPYATQIGTVMVGAEEATIHRIFTLDANHYHVFVVHEGRPYVIGAVPTNVTGSGSEADQAVLQFLRDNLAGFAFLP